MTNNLNPALYTDAVSKLAGGRRRKHSKGGKSRSRKQQSVQKKKQRGGIFPGLGGIIHQALVPFGLYALQHSMKKRGTSSSDSVPSFRKFTRRR